MFKVIIAHSEEIDSQDAVKDLIEQSNNKLEGLKPDAGLLFCSIEYDHQVILDILRAEYPDIELIGCTSEGEVSSVSQFVEDSINLILFCSDEIKIKAGLGEEVSLDPVLASKNAIKMASLALEDKPAFCITTPESLKISQVSIIEGLQSHLGQKFPIVGGSAGGDYEQKKTLQFYKDRVLTDSVPVLLFSGGLKYSFGVASGCSPLGQTKTVTKAVKNIIFELDEEPALDFYRHYFGKHDITTAEHPLVVFEADTENFYTRVPFYFNEENKSITLSGDVPEGARVRLSDMTSESMLEASYQAFNNSMNQYPGNKPALALIFSCAIRKHLLGTRTYKEYEVIKNLFPEELPVGGFYTYGEICPFTADRPSIVHNSTFVVVLLGAQ